MDKQDFYQTLGVEKNASLADIKKAYRKLAMELHPDRNPGNKEAEEKFKQVSEAYGVLSDSEKKAVYDRYGHAGLSGAGFGQSGFGNVDDIFSSFSDIFGDFFGFSGGGRQRRDAPARGADLKSNASISLKEAATGVQRDIEVHFPATCEPCHGTGAENGEVSTCMHCKGTGQITQQRGAFLMQSVCPHCGGMGKIAKRHCPECKGRGEVTKTKSLKVSIPAGIDHGQSIRVPGQGGQGARGGPNGHLYVEVEVQDDPRFIRDGTDLYHEMPLNFTEAALGAKKLVSLLDDSEKEISLPAGTQHGDELRIKGAGMPRVDGRGKGDVIVVAKIMVPKKLSPRAKELLLELEGTFSKEKKQT